MYCNRAVLTSGLQSIGINAVSIPKYFYKVILDYIEPGIKGIGFIIPNCGSGEPLQYFAVSIDSVEKVTGIDFFPKLPDDQEEVIEKSLCIKCWSWTSFKATSKSKNEGVTTYVQCNGFTKGGFSAKIKTGQQRKNPPCPVMLGY